MKKFLTVLLVIAVMFTFSFGSAFAATLTSEEFADAKAYVDEVAATYYDGDFAVAAQQYIAGLAFDADGKLVDGTYGELVDKAIVQKAADTAAYNAEVLFTGEIANYKVALAGATAPLDKTKVIADVKGIFNLAVNGSSAYSYTAVSGNTTATAGLITDAKVKVFADLLKAQLAVEKDKAAAILATDTSVYSNDVDDWSLTITASSAAGKVLLTDKIGVKADGTTPDGPTYGNVTGLASVTSDVVYTAREYADKVIAAQSAVVAGATGTDADTYKTAIGDVKDAVLYATTVIKGQKITTDYAYYVEALPTAEELKADTSVADAKAKAVATIKAKLAERQATLAEAIQDEIDALDMYGSLSAAQKTKLNKLKEVKASLADSFAATEECWVALVGYETTTTGVKAKANTIVNTNIPALVFDAASSDFDNATKTTFTNTKKVSGYVADIKAEAELLALQKDVNGQPYVDADVLAVNLEDAIEYLYTAAEPDYDTARAMLSGSSEVALIKAKIDYIKFITGETSVYGTVIKDKNDKTLTNKWYKSDANAAAGASGSVTAMANGANAGAGFDASATDMYDEAQAKELDALVDDTEAAITAAKTIAEVESIFVAAQEKYEAIPTTEDLYKAWTGKVGTAYTKADYDKELKAYADYFMATKVTGTTDYPAAITNAAYILDNVAYPIVYEAYTVDDLAGKVAEAKAAIDKILTQEEIKAEKAKVETMLNGALTEKDAIEAAAEAVEDYEDIPGYLPLANKGKLEIAIDEYEAKVAKELDAAYKALANKKITGADAEAIEALRDAYDDWAEFVTTYNGGTETSVYLDDADDTLITDLETALSKALVAEAKALMIKLPANPTTADKAQVEAARAAYEALSLKDKAEIVGTLPYKNLIDAEEALGINNDEAAKAYVQDLSIKARSTKTAKGVKVTIKADVKELLDSGYTVEYKFYRSTKSNKGFKAMVTKTTGTYTNTKGVKGTKYFYKVKLVVKNAAGEVVATTPLTQCLYATRTF